MFLKRQYDPQGRMTHVLVKHTGTHAEQNFSDRLVNQWIADEVAEINGDSLTVSADPQDLRFEIKRRPGYYCMSTGERIPVSEAAWELMKATGRGDRSSKEAKAWLQAKGLEATDYEVTNAYECVLDEGLHAKFRAVLDAKGRVVGAHQLKG